MASESSDSDFRHLFFLGTFYASMLERPRQEVLRFCVMCPSVRLSSSGDHNSSTRNPFGFFEMYTWANG